MVITPAEALQRAALSPESRSFLGSIGLPSNALWFDKGSGAIMCFDSVAILRELFETDVSERTWRAVAKMGRLTILGVQAGAFVVADESGRMFLVKSDKNANSLVDPDWKATIFVNQSPSHFAVCLLAYKNMHDVFNREAFNFDAPSLRQAVSTFRRIIENADEKALAEEYNYWAQVLDHLDVW